MELDTKKRKYKLSSSSTSSPSEEDKGFSSGFYQKNITTITDHHVTSTKDGTQSSAFDNLAYASHDDDNVFTPKSDIYFDPSSLQRNQKGLKSRVESAREETVPKRREKGCLILLCVLTVLGLLAGIAVILYVEVFKEKPSSSSNQSSPVILIGSITLKDDWNEELLNSSSVFYKTTAAIISSEMDKIMQSGNFSQIYLETKVLSFSEGSIVTRLRIYFRPDYGSVFKNIEELASTAELHVKGAVQNQYTSLNIQSVNLTGEMQTSTSLPSSTVSTAISSTFSSSKKPGSTLLSSSTVSTTGSSTSVSSDSTPKPFTTTEVTTTPEPPTTEVTTTPEPPTTEVTTTPQPPTTEVTTTPQPPTTEVTTTPQPPTTEVTTTPQPPTTEVTTTPQPPTTEVTTTPQPPTTEVTTTPQPPTTEVTTTPQPPTTEVTTTPQPPTTEVTTTPQPPTTMPESPTTPQPTTTQPTTTTSEPSTTASIAPTPGTCLPLRVTACQALGRNSTKLPNLFNQSTIQETLTLFEVFKMQSCSDNALLYICEMMFPRCKGPSLPCGDFCWSVQRECGNNFELAKEMYCNLLPSDDCVRPGVSTVNPITTTPPITTVPTTTRTASGTSIPTTTNTAVPSSTIGSCLLLQVPECQALGHTAVMFPNAFQHNSILEALSVFEVYKNQSCSPSAMYFLCNLLFPKCNPSTGVLSYPCQGHCNAISTSCPTLLLASSSYCVQLPVDNCEPSYQEPVTTTTQPETTTQPGSCLLLQVPECQALGHTAVMFPNAFQHNSILEALSVFEVYKNQSCSPSAMYFLCNMLFPKCNPSTGVLSYPCQGHCNAISTSCPTLLLASSSYCVQLPVDNCEPSYQEPVTTTTQPETTTQPGSCLLLQVPECQALGHTAVMFPNAFQHNSILEALSVFEVYKNQSCSPSAMYFLCNMLFPKCNPSTGVLSYPCQGHCNAISTSCPTLLLASSSYCVQLPVDNCEPSYQEPVTTTTQPETTTQPGSCLLLQVPECQALGHTAVMFPNAFQHNSIMEALSVFEVYKNQSCSPSAMYFLCNMLFPKCNPSTGVLSYPCQGHCNAISTSCPTLLLASSSYCVQLPVDNCEPSYQEPVTTTTQPETTTQPGLCFTMSVPECQAVNHMHFLLPNVFNDTTVDAALLRFISYKNQSCTDEAMFYLCNLLFPSCDVNTGAIKYPCSSLCNNVQTSCPEFILANSAYCQNLPSTSCIGQDNCLTVNAPECTALGLRYTNLPNTFGHKDLITAKQFFDQFNQESCSPRAIFYTCLMVYPPCESSTGAVKYACQEDCLAVNQKCGNGTQLANLQYCYQLPAISSGNCYQIPPFVTTTAATTTVSQDVCLPLPVPECQAVGHNTTLLPNIFGHQTISDGVDLFNSLKDTACSQKAMYYLCSFMFPVCQAGVAKFPCGDFCRGVQAECGANFLPAQSTYCDKLPTQDCVGSFPGVITTQAPTTIPPLRKNCSETEQYACPDNGRCIMKEWLCDGEPDCWDQSDEANCSSCSNAEFTCLDRTCVPLPERCNEVAACPDQSDERNCVSLSSQSILELSYQYRRLPLCYESWSDSYGSKMCQSLGLGNFSSAQSLQYFTHQYVHLNSSGQVPSYLGNTYASSECQNAFVVTLKCEPRGCGQRLVGSSQVGLIIGGDDAVPGYWPWQVSLQLKLGPESRHTCGGSLIAPNFVLTATHCMSYLAERNVLLGATNRAVAEVTQKRYEIKRIIKAKENFLQYGPGDITLLELNDTVQYTPYIQPICLPEEGDRFTDTSICYASGWGLNSPGDKSYSTMLKDLKMKLWNTNKCNSTTHWNGNITEGYICAGYESSLKSVCTGDSGGPLVCKDNAGIWKLVGISSYVAINCNVSHLPNVFTNVKQYLPWINSQTECKFRCDNGKCLYDNNTVCNRQNDCGDNSDETRLCDMSVNCSFDDSYLCGYNTSGFIWSYGSNNSQTQSSFPWTDHTIGHYPGHFMFGKFGDMTEAILTSPKFLANVQSCVRFYYNRRGQLYDNLLVRTQEFSRTGVSTSKNRYLLDSGDFQDGWRLAFFDLSAGTYQLEFLVTDTLKTALDDVQVIPGFCKDEVCDDDLFRCADDKADPVCLPQSSFCNIVKECNKDESNCQANNTKYTCDFENAMQCGISQVTLDKGEFLMMNGSYLSKAILYQEAFNEHTNNDPKGWMLFALTNLHRLIGDNVQMTQNIFLNNQMFCLVFYYQASTDMTFKVSLESKGFVYELWNFTDRDTPDWTRAQMQLPLVSNAVLTYQLVRTFPSSNKYYKPYIAIDDISIKPGKCPVYVCPVGTRKCATENYCYLSSHDCDRNLDCPDESDEANCTCRNDEFSCNNGRCIPQSSICNNQPDCLDRSDEGAVCAPLRSVTCTFENPFSCGYTSNIGQFRWQRQSGSTPSFYTGPTADHTLGDTTGHYFYAEGNAGVADDTAILTSPNFTTGVDQSLGFYYHILTKNQFYPIQSEGLSVVAGFSNGHSELLWWQNQTSGSDWVYGCVDLPNNTQMTIQFMAKRIGLDLKNVFDADVAIDDITLLLVPCSGDVAVTTPMTTQTPECGFRCENGFCIDENQQCDGINDCRNGEDEYNCPQ